MQSLQPPNKKNKTKQRGRTVANLSFTPNESKHLPPLVSCLREVRQVKQTNNRAVEQKYVNHHPGDKDETERQIGRAGYASVRAETGQASTGLTFTVVGSRM